MFVEAVKKSGKWGLIGLAVASCCVVGTIAKPSTSTTKPVAQADATAVPTEVPTEPAPTEKPKPTADTCKAVVQKWADEMMTPMTLLVDAIDKGGKGDMLGYGKSLEKAMRAYLEVGKPTCDADAMEVHDKTNLAFQAYANAFIAFNANDMAESKRNIESANELLQSAVAQLKTVQAKYK